MKEMSARPTKIAREVVLFEYLCYNECGNDMDKKKIAETKTQ